MRPLAMFTLFKYSAATWFGFHILHSNVFTYAKLPSISGHFFVFIHPFRAFSALIELTPIPFSKIAYGYFLHYSPANIKSFCFTYIDVKPFFFEFFPLSQMPFPTCSSCLQKVPSHWFRGFLSKVHLLHL